MDYLFEILDVLTVVNNSDVYLEKGESQIINFL